MYSFENNFAGACGELFPEGLIFSAILNSTSIGSISSFIIAAGPIFLGLILGEFATMPVQLLVRERIDCSFDDTLINGCAHFLLGAATAVIGAMIGLMLVSTFCSLVVNPFAWPVLLAGGIATLVVLALYLSTLIKQALVNTPELSSTRDLVSQSHEAKEDDIPVIFQNASF